MEGSARERDCVRSWARPSHASPFTCRSARVHALQLMRDLPQAFVANRRLKLTRRRREELSLRDAKSGNKWREFRLSSAARLMFLRVCEDSMAEWFRQRAILTFPTSLMQKGTGPQCDAGRAHRGQLRGRVLAARSRPTPAGRERAAERAHRHPASPTV
jgi:hypothetical protein